MKFVTKVAQPAVITGVLFFSISGSAMAIDPPSTVHNYWIKTQQRGNSVVAQGLVGSEFYSGYVISQYAAGSLQELWVSDHAWHSMTSAVGNVVPNDTWSWAYPTITCRSSASRQWRLFGSGTAKVRQPWDPYGVPDTHYADNQYYTVTLSCVA